MQCAPLSCLPIFFLLRLMLFTLTHAFEEQIEESDDEEPDDDEFYVLTIALDFAL